MAAGGKGLPGQLLGSRTFVFAWQVSMQQMIKKRGKLEEVLVRETTHWSYTLLGDKRYFVENIFIFIKNKLL